MKASGTHGSPCQFLLTPYDLLRSDMALTEKANKEISSNKKEIEQRSGTSPSVWSVGNESISCTMNSSRPLTKGGRVEFAVGRM